MNTDLEATVFASHIDFPKYVVGSDGSVKSFIRSSQRNLVPIKRGKYFGFTLLDRKCVPRAVYWHRLICEVFHGAAPCRDNEVRHKDGVKDHCSADNLMWGTRSQNMRDKERHGTAPQGERHPMAKLRDIDIWVIRELDRMGAKTKEIMLIYSDIGRMQLWRIINRQLWKHLP